MNARCKTEVVQHPAYALLLRQSVAGTPHPPSQTAHHLLLGWMVGLAFSLNIFGRSYSDTSARNRYEPCVCACVCVAAKARTRGGRGIAPTHKHTQPRATGRGHLRPFARRKQRSKRGLMEDERRSRVFNGNVYSIIRSPVAVRQSNISDKKYMHNNTAALCCCCCCYCC